MLAAKGAGLQRSIDAPALDTASCLDFLLNLPQKSGTGKKPIYIWFAFDYDVNMMLGDLPLKGERESIEELRRENSTRWNGYKITYIPRKIFKVSKNGRWFHSTDSWGFFQTTFEKALQDWNIEVPEIITRGKQARRDFSEWDIEDVRAYNNAELDLAVELMEALRASVDPLKLPVRSWHGPGALAGAFLSKNKTKSYLKEIPSELYEVATRAYFGGRIDASGYGFVEPVYHYDIVSAYPAAIRDLPDLTQVEWKRCKGRPPKHASLSCIRLRWDIPRESIWAPFPWRSKNGTIRFPPSGEGWYWNKEVEAAARRFPDSFDYLESWYVEGEISKPFHSVIEEAFAYRKQLKAEGNYAHKSVRLILNSLYGKFAQTVGKAQYYSPVWAGLITAYTRATLSGAISDDVVCMMTDSLWSRKPLDLDSSAQLGAWEEGDETKLVLAMAGLYLAETPDGNSFTWQRGFDKNHPVDIPGIVDRWLDRDPAYESSYTINRFVGMGLASVTRHPWRHWINLERAIKPVPLVGTTKRQPLFPLYDFSLKSDDGYQPLQLRSADEDVLSYPYNKLTTDPEIRILRLHDETEAL